MLRQAFAPAVVTITACVAPCFTPHHREGGRNNSIINNELKLRLDIPPLLPDVPTLQPLTKTFQRAFRGPVLYPEIQFAPIGYPRVGAGVDSVSAMRVPHPGAKSGMTKRSELARDATANSSFHRRCRTSLVAWKCGWDCHRIAKLYWPAPFIEPATNKVHPE